MAEYEISPVDKALIIDSICIDAMFKERIARMTDESVKNVLSELKKTKGDKKKIKFLEKELKKRGGNVNLDDERFKVTALLQMARATTDKRKREEYVAEADRVLRGGEISDCKDKCESDYQETIEVSMKKREISGIEKYYCILLNWILEEPIIYEQVKKYISLSDIYNQHIRSIAHFIFDYAESGYPVNKNDCYSIFNGHKEELKIIDNMKGFRNEMTCEERQKALKDLIIRIKCDSLDRKASQTTDLDTLRELVKEKRELYRTVIIFCEQEVITNE